MRRKPGAIYQRGGHTWSFGTGIRAYGKLRIHVECSRQTVEAGGFAAF